MMIEAELLSKAGDFATFADIQQKGGHTMRIEANFATFGDIQQKGGHTSF